MINISHWDAKKKSFLRLKPIRFGPGTEELSRNIDKEIYTGDEKNVN